MKVFAFKACNFKLFNSRGAYTVYGNRLRIAVTAVGGFAHILRARDYWRLPIPRRAGSVFGFPATISILKPFCGQDEHLEENLSSWFGQAYPELEIILAVHTADDPAAAIAQKVIRTYAGRVSARLIITGESTIPNAKSYSLNRLVREARFDILLMSDSDVWAEKDLLAKWPPNFKIRMSA